MVRISQFYKFFKRPFFREFETTYFLQKKRTNFFKFPNTDKNDTDQPAKILTDFPTKIGMIECVIWMCDSSYLGRSFAIRAGFAVSSNEFLSLKILNWMCDVIFAIL